MTCKLDVALMRGARSSSEYWDTARADTKKKVLLPGGAVKRGDMLIKRVDAASWSFNPNRVRLAPKQDNDVSSCVEVLSPSTLGALVIQASARTLMYWAMEQHYAIRGLAPWQRSHP